MTPAARLQAAIEILDEVIASARDDGPPADTIVTRYFKQRRYAGSKDRRAVRELVFRAIRRSAERPESGRAAILGLAAEEPELLELFGEPRGPEAVSRRRTRRRRPAFVPEWLISELSPLVAEDEWPALLERAPLDLRVNVARALARGDARLSSTTRRPTPLSPWGIRLPPDSRVDDHPAYRGRPRRSSGRGQPADCLRLRARRTTSASSIFAPALAASHWRLPPLLRGANPRDRQQSGAPFEAGATSRTGGSHDRDATAQSAEGAGGACRLAQQAPISCWSTRPARAAAPGGAIPKDAGA